MSEFRSRVADPRVWLSPLGMFLAAGVLTLWISWTIGSLMSRLESPPDNLADLAQDQLWGLIGVTVFGAGLSAHVTTRARSGGGRELLATGARGARELSMGLVVAVGLPAMLAWVVAGVLVLVRFGRGQAFMIWLLAILLGCLISFFGPALGHLIGCLTSRVVAVPIAVAASYLLILVVVSAGDDVWWQGLGPALGTNLSVATSPLWFLAEGAWFLGVSLALTMAASRLLTGRRVEASSPRLALVAAVLAVVGVVGLAVLNVA